METNKLQRKANDRQKIMIQVCLERKKTIQAENKIAQLRFFFLHSFKLYMTMFTIYPSIYMSCINIKKEKSITQSKREMNYRI